MLFYIDGQGVVQAAIPDTVTQGSVGVREIIIIAPFPTSTVVTAFITLPSGLKIYPQYVGREQIENGDYGYKFTPITAFEGKIPTPDGVTVNVWKMTIDRSLTQISGAVHFTFAFVDLLGNVLTSTQATMNVGKATPYLNPTITDNDINTIAGYVAAAQQAAEDAAEAATTAAEEAAEAAAATIAAKLAQAVEDAAEAAEEVISEVEPRIYYDTVITTESTLVGLLDTYPGRVLVKGVHIERDANMVFEVNQACTLLEFRDCTVSDNVSEITFTGNAGCTIRGLDLSGGSYLTTIKINGFAMAENIGQGNLKEYFYTGCHRISNCRIAVAQNCSFIEDCHMYSENDARINSCQFIVGITESDPSGAYGVTFTNCDFISNVWAIGSYTNCKYVDVDTCRGYVPSSDAGKVQVLTADGTFNTLLPVSYGEYSSNKEDVDEEILYLKNRVYNVETSIGDISTALDTLHAYAVSLINGGAV